MNTTFMKRLGVGASLLAMGACVHASPYSPAFPERHRLNGQSRLATAAELCQQAHQDPGASNKVYDCILARGRDWDVRGRGIRTQASMVGQMAIPLNIAGFGLAAADDRSDYGPISGGVTTAALAHTGAYARPDQARVYEMATAAYRCLETAIAEWNRLGASRMGEARTALSSKVDDAIRFLDQEDVRELFHDTEVEDFKKEILFQNAAAGATQTRLSGEVGLEILRRSGTIEDRVREAIGVRMPDPQVVAATLVRPAGNPVDTPANTPPSSLAEPPQQESWVNPTPAQIAAKNRADQQRAKKVAVDEIRRRMIEINTLTSRFDAEASAYADQARSISVSCAFNPIAVPPIVAPRDVILGPTNQGSFLVQGGVQPYGYSVLPRDGLSITVQPIGNGWRFDLSASAAGPWTIYVNDASSVNGMGEIKVVKSP